MSETFFIYGLFDPRQPWMIQYVGKSVNPESRLRVHVHEATSNACKNSSKERWINSLLASGVNPGIRVLETVQGSEWQASEKRHISHFRVLNPQLLNISNGGAGTEIVYEETRRRMSRAMILAHARPEVRALRAKVFSRLDVKARKRLAARFVWADPLFREKMMAIRATAEYKQKQSLSRSRPEYKKTMREVGRGSPEKGTKISAALTGGVFTELHKQHISEGRRGIGHPHTAVSRQKIGLANKGRKRPDLAERNRKKARVAIC